MKNETGRFDSRTVPNPMVMMEFPDEIRIKGEELADKLLEDTGISLDFPNTVILCVEYLHDFVCSTNSLPVILEGGHE